MAVPSSSRYDVFLSYSSDDKPAVEELALWLVREGSTPFLDKWHLVPGEDWTERYPKRSAIALRGLYHRARSQGRMANRGGQAGPPPACA